MTQHRILAFLALACCSICACLPSGTAQAQFGGRPDREPSAELRKIVPSVAAKYKIPGLAVALIENGRVRDLVVNGVRDKVATTPIDENTVFESASLSKPVFAYGVL